MGGGPRLASPELRTGRFLNRSPDRTARETGGLARCPEGQARRHPGTRMRLSDHLTAAPPDYRASAAQTARV
jgi:hypothetical protein